MSEQFGSRSLRAVGLQEAEGTLGVVGAQGPEGGCLRASRPGAGLATALVEDSGMLTAHRQAGDRWPAARRRRMPVRPLAAGCAPDLFPRTAPCGIAAVPGGRPAPCRHRLTLRRSRSGSGTRTGSVSSSADADTRARRTAASPRQAGSAGGGSRRGARVKRSGRSRSGSSSARRSPEQSW